MKMSEKCRINNSKHNNNSDNPLTSRRTDGGKNYFYSRFKASLCNLVRVNQFFHSHKTLLPGNFCKHQVFLAYSRYQFSISNITIQFIIKWT